MVKEKHEKVTIKDWLIVLLALLDDAAVLVLILLALWFFDVKMPLWSIIVLALLLGAFVFIIHRAIIPSLHRKKATGSESMIGLEGRVTEALTPDGVIRVEGEYWKAKSIDKDVAAGENVEILTVTHLTLKVRRKSR